MYIIDGLIIILLGCDIHFRTALADMIKSDENSYTQNVSLHPYFDFDVPRNVTARVGQTAFLHCRVEQLGDKSVSWIRKRDLHILTAGILTYTSDERFQVIRPEKSENWTLQVKFAQLRDSGIYECQVNTEPKMSMAFRLNVVEAKANIIGPSDLYVKMGSIVTLTCIVSQGPHELGTIFWYRGGNILDPRVDYHPNDALVEFPSRISIDTHLTDALSSRLKISDARLSDTGNYSCSPTNAEGASVIVHVINGEHPAAMQRGCASHVEIPLLVYLFSIYQLIRYLRSASNEYDAIDHKTVTDKRKSPLSGKNKTIKKNHFDVVNTVQFQSISFNDTRPSKVATSSNGLHKFSTSSSSLSSNTCTIDQIICVR